MQWILRAWNQPVWFTDVTIANSSLQFSYHWSGVFLFVVLCFNSCNYNSHTNVGMQVHFFMAHTVNDANTAAAIATTATNTIPAAILHAPMLNVFGRIVISMLFHWQASDCLCNLNHLLFVEWMPNEWNRCTAEKSAAVSRNNGNACIAAKEKKNEWAARCALEFIFFFASLTNLNVNF